MINGYNQNLLSVILCRNEPQKIKAGVAHETDRTQTVLYILLYSLGWAADCTAQPISSQFTPNEATQEQIRWRHESNGVRALILSPLQLQNQRRCLIIYATPNGNSLEETLGCLKSEQTSWRFDIQHVAAQIRWLRNQDPATDYIVAVVQAPQLSWPEFRRTNADANRWIAGLVESIKEEVSATEVVLSCHSGGGSFLWGWMNAYEELPTYVNRMIFLDANYSFSTEDGHDRKLLQWLERSNDNGLVVVAYDDREVELDGKKVVGADGGTYRATQRMRLSLESKISFSETQDGNFQSWFGLNGRVQLLVHQNPENKILHTALVGEMNGLCRSLTRANEGRLYTVHLNEPRVYREWIQAEPFKDPRISSAKLDTKNACPQLTLPARPPDAETGSQFCERIAKLERKQRETEIVKAILAGNVPSVSRKMVGIQVSLDGKDNGQHQATYFVMSDYMAIGSDMDFVRMPMTPASAMAICDQLGCELITEKISDDVYSAAEYRVVPHPLTVDRDRVSAFVEHNNAIDKALRGKEGVLTVGIKKDIVLTNRLKEKPHRVAIYGWHYPDGRAIQPLYVGHVDWYVDYSHGLRLMSDSMLVDGVAWKVRDVLAKDDLCGLLSREGKIDVQNINQ